MNGPWQDRRFGTSLTSPYSRSELLGPVPRTPPLSEEELNALIREIAGDFGGIDPALLRAVVEKESHKVDGRPDPYSIGPGKTFVTGRPIKRARGLMQINPITAVELGLIEDVNDEEGWDWEDPRTNLEAGARYLQELLNQFGTEEDALRAYNAGPSYIDDGRKFWKTEEYVTDILGSVPGYEEAFVPPSGTESAAYLSSLRGEPSEFDQGIDTPRVTREAIEGTPPYLDSGRPAAEWSVDDPGVDFGNLWKEAGAAASYLTPDVAKDWLTKKLVPEERDLEASDLGMHFRLDDNAVMYYRIVDGPETGYPSADEMEQAREAFEEAYDFRSRFSEAGGLVGSVGAWMLPGIGAGAQVPAAAAGGVLGDLAGQALMPLRYKAGDYTIEVVSAPDTAAFGQVPVERAGGATEHIWDNLVPATLAGAQEGLVEGAGELLLKGATAFGRAATAIGTFPNTRTQKEFLNHYRKMSRQQGFDDFVDFLQRYNWRTGHAGHLTPGGTPVMRQGATLFQKTAQANFDKMDDLVNQSRNLQRRILAPYWGHKVDRSEWIQRLLKGDPDNPASKLGEFAKRAATESQVRPGTNPFLNLDSLAAVGGFKVIDRPIIQNLDEYGRVTGSQYYQSRELGFRPDWLPEDKALQPVSRTLTIGNLEAIKRMASKKAEDAFLSVSQRDRANIGSGLVTDEADWWKEIWVLADNTLKEALVDAAVKRTPGSGMQVLSGYETQSRRTQAAGALRALMHTESVPYSLWRVAWGIPGVSGAGAALGTGSPLIGLGTTGAFGLAMYPPLQQVVGKAVGQAARGLGPLPQNIARGIRARGGEDIPSDSVDVMEFERPDRPPPPMWMQLPEVDFSAVPPDDPTSDWAGASGRAYRRRGPRAGSAPGQ